ncbi:uncharacterized protein LOC131614520 [Vicia villosa]|uniref:uncharacterized protein LOC131614520 n=1 Tax=Vicia villosa TaxID=3911 RepID=UPI00273C15E0|nr:uncharacterized protein LOC131614520 [Vicia villosa]
MDLVDIPLMGNKFIWFNLDGSACSRLDRFLISDSLLDLWKVKGIMVGERSLSDHCPIWLAGNFVDRGPKPFKMFKCWFDHEEFLPFVEKEWKAMDIRGKYGFILKEKLYILKAKLKSWNREVFGVLDLNVDKAVSTLNDLDLFVDNAGRGDFWSDILSSNRVKASKDVWEAMLRRESMLCQNSRCRWIQQGDANSKYFHSFMRGRFRRNNIVSLNSDGGLLEDVDVIKDEVFEHFKHRFSEPCMGRPVLDGVGFNALSVEESKILEESFYMEEIKNIIWLSDCEKSLGPDGFPLGFFKKTWSFVNKELFYFVQEFYRQGSLPRAATASFWALIPKVDCP